MGLVELLLGGDTGTAEFYEAGESAGPAELAAAHALSRHTDPGVRARVAISLPWLPPRDSPTPDLVDLAITLSADPAPRVRDHACVVLGTQWREVDSVAVRSALAARLEDDDHDARCEALLGLAYRNDPRAFGHVQAALSRVDGNVWTLELTAAGALGDPRLHDLVLRHLAGWEDGAASALTAGLARRLTDHEGVGSDVVDGVADLYARRVRGLPEDPALCWWQLMDAMLEIRPDLAGEFLAAVLVRLEGDDAAIAELSSRSALAVLAETSVSRGRPGSLPAVS